MMPDPTSLCADVRTVEEARGELQSHTCVSCRAWGEWCNRVDILIAAAKREGAEDQIAKTANLLKQVEDAIGETIRRMACWGKSHAEQDGVAAAIRGGKP